MANELFKMVTGYDELINQAYEEDDDKKAELLQKEQDLIVAKIEEMGLREQFDEYIVSLQ